MNRTGVAVLSGRKERKGEGGGGSKTREHDGEMLRRIRWGVAK